MKQNESSTLVADEIRPPFRGEIYDFYKGVPMDRGYANAGDPFDIATANYLREPLQTIKRRVYGKFVIKAAVQMLKTYGGIEMPAGYFMANAQGDMIIFISGDESAFDHAKSRLGPLLRSQPQLAKIFADVIASSSEGRFNITTDEIYLPGMVLRIWPLNMSSTQRNTLRYVFISDAFLAAPGMIGQAIKRTTQHNTVFLKDYKIVIESQGSEGSEGEEIDKNDDDFTKQWKETDKRILHVACPHCASAQPFEWHRQRPEDFMPTPPIIIPSLDHRAWIEHHRPLLVSEDGKHCGMRRGEDKTIKLADGTYDERAVLKQTHYQCYHCGSIWEDDKPTRLKIDESSTYVPSRPSALPENIGWWWPVWAGQRIAWGTTMLRYLNSKASAALGNHEDLKQWYQKEAGKSWDAKITRATIEIAPGSYDPNQVMPDEFCRNMAVDAQQDQGVMDKTGISRTGWFWYIIRAVDKFGNSRQLARGFSKTWEGWITEQKKWKVPNDRVSIDIGHWPDQIMQRAAAEHESIKVEKPLPPFLLRERPVTWLLFLGSDDTKFGKHMDGKTRTWSPPQAIPVTVFDKEGRRKIITLKKVRWSNHAFKTQLDAIRSGAPSMPKMDVLDPQHLDELSQQMETGNRTYEKQMESEYLTVVRNKDKFESLHPDSHYRDCECMLLVRQAIDGMLGHLAIAQEQSAE